jgi:hypothetical protein
MAFPLLDSARAAANTLTQAGLVRKAPAAAVPAGRARRHRDRRHQDHGRCHQTARWPKPAAGPVVKEIEEALLAQRIVRRSTA